MSIGPTQQGSQNILNVQQSNWFREKPVFPGGVSSEIFLEEVVRELNEHPVVVFFACHNDDDLQFFLLFFTQKTGVKIAYRILDEREPLPYEYTSIWKDNPPFAEFKILSRITAGDELPEEIKAGLFLAGVEKTIDNCLHNFKRETTLLLFIFLHRCWPSILRKVGKSLETQTILAAEHLVELGSEITKLETEQIELRETLLLRRELMRILST